MYFDLYAWVCGYDASVQYSENIFAHITKSAKQINPFLYSKQLPQYIKIH